MALPTLITVTGIVRDADGPVSGRMVFASSTILRDEINGDVVTPDEITAVVGADGVLSVAVPATDDPNFSPTGWTWEVRPHFPNWKTPFSVAVPYDSPGGTLKLGQLTPVPPDGTAQLYATVNHTHAGGGGGGDVVYSTTVASETAYGQASNAGNSLSVSRGNHTHGTPPLPTAAQVGADPTGTAAAAVAAHAAAGDPHPQYLTAAEGNATYQPLGSYAASVHTHTASQISDSTTTGRAVLLAADAAAARTAIGAGTSNLALGTTSATALAGDALATHVAAADPHTQYPRIFAWNGSAYVLSTTGDVYIGPAANDPGTLPDGSVWIKTT